ncbi:MAG: Yip1 family protein [Candidatus Aminicenantales bacterium]
MDLVQRVQSVILRPKEEWVKIKAETTTVKEIFTSYVMLLAAIPAAAQFLGNILIGRRLPFYGMYRWGVGRALGNAILSYVFALATVYLFAVIVNALAPNFSSAQNMTNAVKLAAYSMTPGWVAGVFYVIPALWILGLLASLYGLYILYLGFDNPIMGTPKDKVMGYMGISILVVIALYVVFGLIAGGVFAVRGV